MTSSEKRVIMILIIITIIVSVIKINRDIKLKKSNNEQVVSQVGYAQESEGVKTNTSNKLKETKKFGDFEITNVKIIEQGGVAIFTANVTNTSSNRQKEFPFTIKLLNDQGEIIQNLGAYVGKTDIGETKSINASIDMDISQIYDISIEL